MKGSKKKILKEKLLSKKSGNNINIIYKLLILLLLIVSIGSISFYGYIFIEVMKWEKRIYPNVKIYDLNLSGLNKEKALELIDLKYEELINKKVILAEYKDKRYEISYKDLEVNYNKEAIIKEAINYGKDENFLKKYKLIKSNYEVAFKPELTYNEEIAEKFFDRIIKDINIEKKEGTILVSQGNIKRTKDITGIKVKENDLKTKFEYSINGKLDFSERINIEVLKEEAKVKEEDLVKVNGKLSEYKSYFYNNEDGRITNMKIASKTIDGVLLMPGEVFSYNELIGETTPEKGYDLANTYVGNKVVPDYGGGICQVSTALYRAAMRANMRSVERVNHSMIVSYSEPSLDATVANGYIDYKFKNTYNSPVYIEAYLLSDNVTINIYGNLNEKGSRSYELISKIHKTYKFDIEYEEDKTMNIGEEDIIKSGMNGYESSAYLVTYENGIEIDREKISDDYYAKSNKVVKRGVKKVVDQD